MTTEYSTHFNWMAELSKNYDNWENLGRNIAEQSCTHTTQNKEDTNMYYSGWCEEYGQSETSNDPMMNYGYLLHNEPTEEQIKEVIDKTCLTIMHKIDSDDYYLVLCGGGMDLSQDIALAYTICGYIPDAMAFEVSMQYGLSKSGENWFRLMNKCKETLQYSIDAYKYKIERIENAIKEAKKHKDKTK